jgi:hypothetical protein
MVCSQCGRQVKPEEKFCSNCGTPNIPSSIGSNTSQVTVWCPSCSKAMGPNLKFCSNCGYPLTPTPQQIARPQPDPLVQIPDSITLHDGEIPLWSGKMSWASNWFLLLLGILTIWFLVGVLFFLVAAINVYSTEYFFSNQRIFIRYGILGRKIFDIKNEWVTNFVFSQGIMGRILNYGDLVISTPGEFGGAAKMTGVGDPLRIKSLMEKTIKKKNY